MPLTMTKPGEDNRIKKIIGKDEVRNFLERLGFLEGESVSIVSELSGNMIISIKGTRVALDKTMASRIMV